MPDDDDDDDDDECRLIDFVGDRKINSRHSHFL